MVEATIAMHTVFDSPRDKIVFDVSHQSYTHKMLTGRKDAFLYEEKYDDVSGYTNPDESEHDFFNIGHTSTGISLASGLAKARDLKGEKYNVIALSQPFFQDLTFCHAPVLLSFISHSYSAIIFLFLPIYL